MQVDEFLEVTLNFGFRDCFAVHKAKRLIIPENIVLIFLPQNLIPLKKSGQNTNESFLINFIIHWKM